MRLLLKVALVSITALELVGLSEVYASQGSMQADRPLSSSAPPIGRAIILPHDHPSAPTMCNDHGKAVDCTVSAAQAAIDQAEYARLQTIIGFGGFLAGFGTLLAAIWAGRWARSAVFETRNATFAEHRPWISVNLVPVSGVQQEPGKPGYTNIYCRIELTNVGRGVASRATAAIKVYEIHKSVAAKPATRSENNQGWVGLTLLPGQSQTQDCFANFAPDGAIAIVTAWYVDPATGKEHRTCSGFARASSPLSFQKVPIGNSAT